MNVASWPLRRSRRAARAAPGQALRQRGGRASHGLTTTVRLDGRSCICDRGPSLHRPSALDRSVIKETTMELARCLVDLGARQRAAGERRAALAILRDARERATALYEQARAELLLAGGRPRSPAGRRARRGRRHQPRYRPPPLPLAQDDRDAPAQCLPETGDPRPCPPHRGVALSAGCGPRCLGRLVSVRVSRPWKRASPRTCRRFSLRTRSESARRISLTPACARAAIHFDEGGRAGRQGSATPAGGAR
jgi:hypothetical protein